MDLEAGIAASKIIPGRQFELLDASGADAEATYEECNYIWVATGGIAKIDYTGWDGVTVTEIVQLQAGVNQFAWVTKLYRYYTATTAGTATALSQSDGSSITNAIKLKW